MIPILLLLMPVALVAAVAAAWLFTRPRLGFAVLLLLLPFHTGVFQIARVELRLSPTVSILLQSWKEMVILLLLGWVAWNAFSTGRLRGAYLWMIGVVALFVLTGLLALRNSPGLATGLYSFRGTFEPFLVLLLTLLLPLDLAWFRRLMPFILLVGGLISAFAIYQSLFLGFPFLWKYYSQGGALPTSFVFMGGRAQRAMGTFSSPNQISLYLAMLTLAALNLFIRQPRRYRLLLPLVGLFTAALILTVSRSGWLALLAGLAFSFLIWRRKQRLVLAGAAMAVLAVVIALELGLDTWLLHTLSGREISANYHINIFQKNVGLIYDHPLGVGLGRVGGRTGRFQSVQGEAYYATESYLLQTGMELGLPGLLLFGILVSLCAAILYQNIYQARSPWSRAMAVTGLACLIAAGVHSLLIPDLQDITVNSYLWFIVGLGLRLPGLERQEEARLA